MSGRADTLYPVSDAFLTQARAASQRAVVQVAVADQSGAVLYTSTVTLDGKVSEDATAAIRRACEVTFVDETGDLTPRDVNDLLMPLGNELRIYRGLLTAPTAPVYADVFIDTFTDTFGVRAPQPPPTPELVPLGVFGISKPRMSVQDDAVVIAVDGYDRARRIQRATLVDTYTIPAGADLADAVAALLRNRWPQCPQLRSLIPPTVVAHRGVIDIGADPWQALRDLVTAYGAEVFFDEVGVPLLRAIPNPVSQQPVISYERGLDNVLVDIDRALDDENTFSGVLAVGESTSADAPVRGVVWDSDPHSPTYYAGPFGMAPYPYTSDQITTAVQAALTAQALLPTVTGVLESVAHEQVPNPALQASDLVANTDDKLGVQGWFSLERVDTPLAMAGTQSVTSKARRLAA